MAALIGGRLAPELRALLAALAIADDIGAMLVIAFFYGTGVAWGWLGLAFLLLAALMALNIARVDAAWPFVFLGILVWVAFLGSGLHATVAGVLVACTIPARSRMRPTAFAEWAHRRLDVIAEADVPGAHVLEDDTQQLLANEIQDAARYTSAPLQRLECALLPTVTFVILPLFALANAAVPIPLVGFASFVARPVTAGVILGLVLGKQLGITAFSWIAVRLRIAALPEGVTWRSLHGMAWLGGIGFSMSLFMTNLAFRDPALAAEARLGIVVASVLSAVGAFAYFRLIVPSPADDAQ